jgi:predicted alpha-1,6-mannanase (GH76 family)
MKLIRSRYAIASLALVLVLVLVLVAEPAHAQERIDWGQRTTDALETLQTWYDPATGLYKTTGWWNSANAITTLADYAGVIRTKRFNPVFATTFTAAQHKYPGFINDYYDDEGWWALAWIDVYDRTLQRRYLRMAESIFADMRSGWSDTCGGGIWWSKERKYKNAIANELFLSVAAHLAERARRARERKEYLSWAAREWQWFSASGMINDDHLVNDGLTSACANNHRTTWTYNQGVMIGALVELSRAQHDPAFLTEAHAIADAALAAPALRDAHGILRETCEPKCGGDGSQFKGIFVRNLRTLCEAAPQPEYRAFVDANAKSIWQGAQEPGKRLGLMWAAPYGTVNASTQSSALDALVTALSISRNLTSDSGQPAR